MERVQEEWQGEVKGEKMTDAAGGIRHCIRYYS